MKSSSVSLVAIAVVSRQTAPAACNSPGSNVVDVGAKYSDHVKFVECGYNYVR